jgi:hypothetical protein
MCQGNYYFFYTFGMIFVKDVKSWAVKTKLWHVKFQRMNQFPNSGMIRGLGYEDQVVIFEEITDCEKVTNTTVNHKLAGWFVKQQRRL